MSAGEQNLLAANLHFHVRRQKMIIGSIAAFAVMLAGAPVAAADSCEDEFDWAAPYMEALNNCGLGHIAQGYGIRVALAAEDICQGSSAYGIADEYGFGLATAEQIALAAYDVCPEMKP